MEQDGLLKRMMTSRHMYWGVALGSASQFKNARQALRENAFGFIFSVGLSPVPLIVNIFSGSPAQKAGLQTGSRALQLNMVQIPVGGDIIVSVNDEPVESYKDLVLYLESNTDIGDQVELTLYRNGEKMTKTVKVEERPKQLTLKQRVTTKNQGKKQQIPSPKPKNKGSQ